jgi:hypothetical protein
MMCYCSGNPKYSLFLLKPSSDLTLRHALLITMDSRPVYLKSIDKQNFSSSPVSEKILHGKRMMSRSLASLIGTFEIKLFRHHATLFIEVWQNLNNIIIFEIFARSLTVIVRGV